MELSVFIDPFYWGWDLPAESQVKRCFYEMACLRVNYVDFQNWDRFPRRKLKKWAEAEGIKIDSIAPKCTDGSLEAGAFPSVISNPSMKKQLSKIWEQTCEAAGELGAKHIMFFGGRRQKGFTYEEQMESVERGLELAIPFAEKNGVILTMEIINPYDHPGELFYNCHQLADMIRRINHPNIRILWDFYHEQRSNGELIGNYNEHAGLVEHIHIADVPGRLQPGTGEINYTNILHAVRESDYRGRIALECIPMGMTRDVLTDMKYLFDRVQEMPV